MGLWTRSMIAWPDGRCDVSTRVAWLQGPELFADLRQPPDLATQLSGPTCLNALTMTDCLALAAQQGFAGRFEQRADGFEWVRIIDYQPPSGVRDIGRLCWRDGVLVEEGVETEYTEHWHRDASTAAQPYAAVSLSAPADGLWGCLLRVGDSFMYARDRRAPVAGSTLAEAVAGASSLGHARALVDFEISLGGVGPAGWRIVRSSLPYKLDTAVDMRATRESRIVLPDIDAAGRPFRRIWDIAGAEGDISALLDKIPEIS